MLRIDVKLPLNYSENDIKDKIIDVYPGLKDYVNNLDTNMLMTHTVGNAGNIVGFIIGFISSLTHKIVTAFFGFVFAIYILADKEHLMKEGKRILGAFRKRGIHRWYGI